ncbi:MAG: WD40/YVTN/BNR-like repeat-containing protein [Anaerolineae bacterium]
MRRLTRLVLAGIVSTLVAGCAGATPSVPPTLTHAPTRPPSPTPFPTPSPLPTATLTATPTPAPTPTATPSPTPPPTLTPLPPTTVSPLTPWEPLPIEGLPGPWVNDIAFATPTTVFAIAADDLYRSDDSGATWTLSFSIYRGMRSLAVSPAYAADQTVFAADGRSLLFRSTDGGETWEELVQIAPVGGASDADIYLSISPAYPADPTLWAVVEGGAAYRSTDSGLTWEQFDPGFELPPMARLAPNPNYPADPTLTMVDPTAVGDLNLPEGLSAYPLALAESGGTLLLGTMRGLYRSTDSGATWADANSGLPASPVETAVVASDGTLYGSVGGEPRLFRSPAGGTRWEPLGRLPEGEDGEISIYGIAATPPVLVVTTYDRFFVSRDGGLTWERMAGEGLPWVSYRRLAPLFSADFAARGVAHLAYSGDVYRTEDWGDTWIEMEGPVGVKKLLESPDGRLIALASGSAYEWDPQAGEWVRRPVDFGFGGEPIVARFVTEQLAVAVMDDKIYLSEDGGRGWTRIGRSELEQAYDYLISPRFDADRAIYAQSATGIYVSTDAGRTWVGAGEGLPPCEYYGGPECDLALLGGVRSDTGYTIYASVRHDFQTRLWMAHAEED